MAFTELRRGSSGNSVKELQSNLSTLGYASYLKPYGVDGNYGSKTENAVMAFQASNGIIQTGVVDWDTFSKIKSKIIGNNGGIYSPTEKQASGASLGQVLKTQYSKDYKARINYLKNTDPRSSDIPKLESLRETKISILNSRCVITNLNTLTRIYFYFDPEEVSDSLSLQEESQSIRGRIPFIGYNSTEARIVSFSFQMHEDYSIEPLEVVIRRLKALLYPEYKQFTIAPRAYVNIANGLSFIGICESLDINHKKPIREGKYIMIEGNISFKEVVEVPFGSKQMEGGLT